MDTELITLMEASKQLGISRARTYQLVQQGRLPAKRMGHMFFINPKDLEQLKGRKAGWKKGRKRKPKTELPFN